MSLCHKGDINDLFFSISKQPCNRGFMPVYRKVLLLLILLIAACSPAGQIIDKSLSTSHYFTFDRSGVIYGPMGNCFELGCDEIQGADSKSFRPIDDSYALDKNHVYYKLETLKGVSPDTFRGVGDGYLVAERVFYKGKPIEALDPDSFKLMPYVEDNRKRYYGQDNFAVYCGSRVISKDPEKFRELPDMQRFFKDGSDVYTFSPCKALGANPNSFKRLKKTDGSLSIYGRDDDKVFVLHVYNRELLGADPASFKALCEGKGPPHIAIDDERVWDFGQLVVNANPNTFEYPDGCSP